MGKAETEKAILYTQARAYLDTPRAEPVQTLPAKGKK
jgi:hypothetical protein